MGLLRRRVSDLTEDNVWVEKQDYDDSYGEWFIVVLFFYPHFLFVVIAIWKMYRFVIRKQYRKNWFL